MIARISRSAIALGILAASLVAAGCPRAWGQTEIYCTINKSKIDTLTNATRVTISADGLIQGEFDRGDYWIREGNDYRPAFIKRFPFKLTNARTKIGSFIDVSTYPISHISMTIPRESREGVGLDMEVVLYRRANLERIQFNNRGGTGTWDWDGNAVRIEQSRDGRQLIITARTGRYRQPEETKEEVAPERSSLEVTRDDQGLVTVKALNTELGKVLRAVSDVNGMQIAIRGGANYRSSMSIEGAPTETLMRAVSRAYGLSVRSVGGIYFVTEGLPTEVDSYWAAPTATFALYHIPAAEALELLPEFLLRYVHADPERNALVATGPPQLLDKLESDLRAVDQPVPQIQLSAIVVEKVADDSLDLASEIVYGRKSHEFQASGDTGGLSYRIVPEAMRDLHIKLRALEESGVIRTRICPTVTTLSGRMGNIFLGRRQFFAFNAPARRGRQEVVLESTDVGSRIITMPWTGDGEHIKLLLRVEANTVLTVDSEGLPSVATRSAQGGVRVTSGDTVVFGGMLVESPSNGKRRAGRESWPIVSGLGRGKTRRNNLTEALVLLSARASYDYSDFGPTDRYSSKGGAG